MIVAAFISDRGDRYLPGCIESFCKWSPHVTSTKTIDDSDHQLGMAGAVQAAWAWALSEDAEYLFHIEEDFRFEQPAPLKPMQKILDQNPHLAQVVLKRQPWSADEIASGGIIETKPGAYTQCENWVEHSEVFSLNPCLIPRRTLELGWPSGPLGVGNESGFTKKCLDVGMRFAFYGRIEDPPRVRHVGHHHGDGWRL